MPTGTAGRRSCSGGDIYIPRLSLAGTVAWSITRRTCYAPSRWVSRPAGRNVDESLHRRLRQMEAALHRRVMRGPASQVDGEPASQVEANGGR